MASGGGAFLDKFDESLTLYKSHEIASSDSLPTTLLGRIGLMLCWVKVNDQLQQSWIADLRFVDADDLPTEDTSAIPDNQEESNYYFDDLADMVKVAAFIAPSERKDEVDIGDYDYYGPDVYHSFLNTLREASNKIHSSATQPDKPKSPKHKKGKKSDTDDDSGGSESNRDKAPVV